MKSRTRALFHLLAILVCVRHAVAQNTAFKYQGQLQNNGSPASGLFSVAFSLFTNSAQGDAVVGPVTYNEVSVTNGLFTVLIDFGSAQWTGQSNWLQISVATNGSVNFTQLSPRQLVAPVPYAIYAESAGNFTGDIATNSLPGFQAPYNTIGGGRAEITDGLYGTVGGGEINSVSGSYSTVGGGYDNGANYNAATVAGGTYNIASNQNATVGGGYDNSADGADSGIFSGSGNLITAGGSAAFIGGGQGSLVTSEWGTLGGGMRNLVSGQGATIGGGSGNDISAKALYGFIGGGATNLVEASDAVVDGGNANIASGLFSSIVGGASNLAVGSFSFIGGGQQNRAWRTLSTIGGGSGNSAWAEGDTVVGGDNNTAGDGSDSSSVDAAVGGGENNTSSGEASVVSGGFGNTASGEGSALGGGLNNIAGGEESVVAGGLENTASGEDSVVSGGIENTATGQDSMVGGGFENTAAGQISFAAGGGAQAMQDGTFVWADSQPGHFTSTGDNQFLVRAGGGVGINTASPTQDFSVRGGVGVDISAADNGTLNTAWTLLFGGAVGEGIGSNRSSGSADSYGLDFYTDFGKRMVIEQHGNVGIANANPSQLLVVGNAASPAYCDGQNWVNASDRNAKQDFRPIDSTSLLDKISSLPISEWQYKADTNGQRHIGPMAQDFHAAFGLNGDDDKHISTVDEGGVALAAIQELNKKLAILSGELNLRDAENADLKSRLEKLEALSAKLPNIGAH